MVWQPRYRPVAAIDPEYVWMKGLGIPSQDWMPNGTILIPGDWPLYCLSLLVARTARKVRVPEDRLSDLPVAGRSVRFPEGASRRERGGWGDPIAREIRQRLPGWVRPIAPAQGRAGAAEFDTRQIRQEK